MSDAPDITLAASAILTADPDVSAITTDIFINRLPQSAPKRSIVLWVISETPWNHLGGEMFIDESLMQINSYGDTIENARELAWRVARAFDGMLGTFAGVRIIGNARRSGIRDGTDRPLVGTDQYRYVATQDIRFTYQSFERVV